MATNIGFDWSGRGKLCVCGSQYKTYTIPLQFVRVLYLFSFLYCFPFNTMKFNLIVVVAALVGSTFALPSIKKLKQTPLGVPYQGKL